MADLLLIGGSVFFVALGWFVSFMVWRRQFDAYTRGQIGTWFIGPPGKHGYDAATAFGAVVITLLALLIVGEVTVDLADHNAIALPIVVALLVSISVCLSLLLFLRPRILVPPHLRGEHGWLVAVCHGWSSRRRRRLRR